jgi:DNA invertase Pin-like site-specific DNA recombinase
MASRNISGSPSSIDRTRTSLHTGVEGNMEGKFIAYYRVSTDKQGQSGLGLDAQRAAVMNYLNGGSWKLVGEFTEVESGKHSDRVQLRAAQAACKKHKAKLVIAKLDRLSRNVAFIANLLALVNRPRTIA